MWYEEERVVSHSIYMQKHSTAGVTDNLDFKSTSYTVCDMLHGTGPPSYTF